MITVNYYYCCSQGCCNLMGKSCGAIISGFTENMYTCNQLEQYLSCHLDSCLTLVFIQETKIQFMLVSSRFSRVYIMGKKCPKAMKGKFHLRIQEKITSYLWTKAPFSQLFTLLPDSFICYFPFIEQELLCVWPLFCL